jgi:threonine synthase
MKLAYVGWLTCLRCGHEVGEDDAFEGCPRCRSEGVSVNVLPAYDLSRVEEWEVDQDAPGLFRYRSLLPLDADTAPVSRLEGGTPMVPLRTLGREIGVDRLLIKDESRNPTWSYKDRLAAVAVTKAAEQGAEAVVVATTGNHGAAVSAYAAAAGIRCVVLTLESVPLTMKVLMQSYGAEVVALRRGPDRWRVMAEGARSRGWMPMSGYLDPPVGSNPFGIDGYKTIAFEIVDQMEQPPDVVVVPTAYADGLVGILRGFEDLVELGRINSVPRLVASEPLGPYTATLQSNGELPLTVELRPSVAFSTATPVATYQGVHALLRSNGTAGAVLDDEDILSAQRLVARSEGLFLEAAAAVSIPVVQDLASSAWISEGETVVMIGTSTGLKDIDAPARHLPEVPVIDPELNALDAALSGQSR